MKEWQFPNGKQANITDAHSKKLNAFLKKLLSVAKEMNIETTAIVR